MLFEGEADAALELANGAKLLGGAGFEDDGEDHLRAFDGVDPEDLRVLEKEVFEFGAVADFEGDLLEQLCNLVGIGGEVDADVDGGDGESGTEVGDGGDLRVGNDVEGAVAVADHGFAQGERLDDTGDSGEADGVAHAELAFDEEEDAVEHIFDDVLRGEADGDAGDSGRGEEWGEIEAHGVEGLECGYEADDGQASGANDAGEGFDFAEACGAGAALLGYAGHVESGEAEETTENKGDDGDADEARELGVQEFLAIGDPLVEHFAQEAAFGEPAGSHGEERICSD